MRYKHIEENRFRFGIEEMASALQVSRSGYYRWCRHSLGRYAAENTRLLQRIKEIYTEHKGRYGSPTITHILREEGERCSRNRVARLMRINGIRCKTVKKFKATTDSQHSKPVAPNLLAQNFSASAPNQKWVSDITYIWTREGWLYLAVIIDLFSRKVVGWSMSTRIDRFLVMQALTMAFFRCHPLPGLIFHSDRGSQYCSSDVRNLLLRFKMIASMSGKGNCFDNAVAESFFHTFKNDIRFEDYQTREEARTSIFEYIEVYFNRIRRHSYLGYLSPEVFEQMRKVA